jgi:methyl-CpG-binding domain protein 4
MCLNFLFAAPFESLQSLLQPLGLHTTRSKRLVHLSKLYLDDPPSPNTLRQSRPYVSSTHLPDPSPSPSFSLPTSPSSPSPVSPTRKTQRNRYVPTSISHLPGAGAYALDSYRIFCMQPDEWKNVMPSDKVLIKYLVSVPILIACRKVGRMVLIFGCYLYRNGSGLLKNG